MGDYHFDEKDQEFDMTIRLDKINEQVKQHELQEDDLGDKNAYLDMFHSERLDDTLNQTPNIKTPIPPKHEPQKHEPQKHEPQKHERPREERSQTQKSAYDALKTPPPDDYDDIAFNFRSKKFYGLLALLAVILVLFGFAFTQNILPAMTDSPVDAEETIPVDLSSYLVKEILPSEQIVVLETSSNTSITISIDENTIITNAKEEVLYASPLEMGDLIFMALDDEKVATEITYAGFKEVQETNLKIDTTQKTITGTGAYTYNTNAIFQFKGTEIQPQELVSSDVILLKCIGSVVWSAEVLEYHGYLSLSNAEGIENGFIQINGNSPMTLDIIDGYVLPEGKHEISISGDTIETTTDTITIVAEQEYFYDLTKTQTKMGVVLVQSNVTEPRIYIDGTLIDNTETIVLPYGSYDVVILKNGYEDWNNTLVVDNETMNVTVNMTKMVSEIGVLSLTSNVSKGDVYVQDTYMGETPLEISLPYGSYHIEIEKRGYETFSTRIYVNTSMIELNAELEED